MQKEMDSREADELAWSNGMYMRMALQSVYLMVNGFVPKGSKAVEYPQKPYSIQEEERKREETRKQKEEEKSKDSMALFHAMSAAFNRGFAKRQLEEKLKNIPQRT